MLVEVSVQVLLRLELPGQLLSMHVAEGPLLRLRDLIRVHLVIL